MGAKFLALSGSAGRREPSCGDGQENTVVVQTERVLQYCASLQWTCWSLIMGWPRGLAGRARALKKEVIAPFSALQHRHLCRRQDEDHDQRQVFFFALLLLARDILPFIGLLISTCSCDPTVLDGNLSHNQQQP